MSDQSNNLWFGVRAVYQFGRKKNGRFVFEERICAFSAKSSDEALKKAEAESIAYATALGMKSHGTLVAYEQDGDPLIDGYEVWSELYEHDGDLDSFIKSRYENFEYTPQENGSIFKKL